MSGAKAYASTDVPVVKSQEELRGLLRSFGADQFSLHEGREWAGLEFIHGDLLVRLRCPLRPYSREDAQAIRQRSHSRLLTPEAWPEHEARRMWRVLVWSVKSRLVAVEEGLESFEQAFLSHLVDPATDRTIWQTVREPIEAGRLRLGGPGLETPALEPGEQDEGLSFPSSWRPDPPRLAHG